MKNQSWLPAFLASTLLFVNASAADTLIFRNGNRVEGTLVSADGQSFRFSVSNHVNVYNRADIESLQLTSAGVPAAADSSVQNNASRQVPSGTEIVVRLIDPVDSETDRLGQSYRASVDQPVVVDGQTLVSRGADSTVTLIDAKNSGKIEGRTALTLDLKSITVDGKRMTLQPAASRRRAAREALDRQR